MKIIRKLKMNPICINGANGEGGGQILRTALSLSAITGRPFRIDRIRAGRKRPGLLRQHLTCVGAVAEICDAHVEGLTLGSEALEFVPGEIRSFDGRFEISSAGSAGLLLQTVLPVLLHAPDASSVEFGGGTHAIYAPCFHYLDEVFLPQIRAMGARVGIELTRYGFFPAGGGRIRLEVQPSKLSSYRGAETVDKSLDGAEIITTATIAETVVEREIDALCRQLNLKRSQISVTTVEDSVCPGNAVLIRVRGGDVGTLVAGFGERGKRAERVIRDAATEVKRYLSSSAPVDEYLADQLVLPIAIAGGGEFYATRLSSHSKTNINTITDFLSVSIQTEAMADGSHRVIIKS